MNRFHFPIAGLLIVLACAPAHSQQELQCAVADVGDSLDRALFGDLDAGDSKTIQFEAGQFAAQLGEKPSATMSGGVLVQQGEWLAGAERANFSAETMALRLQQAYHIRVSMNAVCLHYAETLLLEPVC